MSSREFLGRLAVAVGTSVTRCPPRGPVLALLAHTAGWRMASTAMRLAILAALLDTSYMLIDGRHFERTLP